VTNPKLRADKTTTVGNTTYYLYRPDQLSEYLEDKSHMLCIQKRKKLSLQELVYKSYVDDSDATIDQIYYVEVYSEDNYIATLYKNDADGLFYEEGNSAGVEFQIDYFDYDE
jgi:hypothetical protein